MSTSPNTKPGAPVSRLKQFRSRFFSLILGIVLIGIARILYSHIPSQEVILHGQAYGTTWQVQITQTSLSLVQQEELLAKVTTQLESLDATLSIYRPDSEISRFNQYQQVDKPFTLSPDNFTVLRAAHYYYQATEGAFDITVAPLINAWGFGPKSILRPPEESVIQDLLTTIGMQHLILQEPNQILKKLPQIQVNLGGIAKGYAVDQIAALLQTLGFEHYMVEIGGEVLCRGNNTKGQPWKIGIDQPTPGSLPGENLQGILAVTNHAVATSGDYRQFIEWEGKTASHTLDPRTGYPVPHTLASVCIIAPTCMAADALATGVNVLGPLEGLKLVEKLEDVEACFIIKNKGQGFTVTESSGFPQTRKPQK